jgi:hypothetical protein
MGESRPRPLCASFEILLPLTLVVRLITQVRVLSSIHCCSKSIAGHAGPVSDSAGIRWLACLFCRLTAGDIIAVNESLLLKVKVST